MYFKKCRDFTTVGLIFHCPAQLSEKIFLMIFKALYAIMKQRTNDLPTPQPCEDGEHCRCCKDGTCCWCSGERGVEGPESAYDTWAEYELDKELDRQ